MRKIIASPIIYKNTIKKQFLPYKQTRIVIKYDVGIKPSIIAAEGGLSVNSICSITTRYRVQKSLLIIIERNKRVLLRIIANNPFIKNTYLLQESISIATVYAALRAAIAAIYDILDTYYGGNSSRP